jgi:hypothetical protein
MLETIIAIEIALFIFYYVTLNSKILLQIIIKFIAQKNVQEKIKLLESVN